MANQRASCPFISLPPKFQYDEVDYKYSSTPRSPRLETSLGVLTQFQGTYLGAGFNIIFRPNNTITPTSYPATFPNLVAPFPGRPNLTGENVLEINVTSETLAFTKKNIGNVPNRGRDNQGDIFLAGAAYVHSVSDMLNPTTGKADASHPQVIHYEPGLWMQVPASQEPQSLPATLTRMGSIPHGTTINASGLSPPNTLIPGPPKFKPVNPVPSVEFSGALNNFKEYSLKADFANSPRIPQDLTRFIATGTITQDMLDNPSIVLQNANQGKNIVSHHTFSVSAGQDTAIGNGIVNIGFLQGSPAGQNASVTSFKSTFWVENVQYEIPVPICVAGEAQVIPAPKPQPGSVTPSFLVTPPRDITFPTTISVIATQIQYSQNVNLFFGGVNWPHISVATLVPQDPVPVPDSAFD
jgi:hypothetical protein